MDKSWYFDTVAGEAELTDLRHRIWSIRDYTTKRDLYVMHKQLDDRFQEILREQARCKLAGRQSSNHKNLVQGFCEQRDNFIDYMTLGMLSL